MTTFSRITGRVTGRLRRVFRTRLRTIPALSEIFTFERGIVCSVLISVVEILFASSWGHERCTGDDDRSSDAISAQFEQQIRYRWI
jgi:hypothetical protein